MCEYNNIILLLCINVIFCFPFFLKSIVFTMKWMFIMKHVHTSLKFLSHSLLFSFSSKTEQLLNPIPALFAPQNIGPQLNIFHPPYDCILEDGCCRVKREKNRMLSHHYHLILCTYRMDESKGNNREEFFSSGYFGFTTTTNNI